MTDKKTIEGPSGLKPMHSFDLSRVLLDQYVLGKRKINLYKNIARRNRVPENEIKRIIRNYRDFLDGKP